MTAVFVKKKLYISVKLRNMKMALVAFKTKISPLAEWYHSSFLRTCVLGPPDRSVRRNYTCVRRRVYTRASTRSSRFSLRSRVRGGTPIHAYAHSRIAGSPWWLFIPTDIHAEIVSQQLQEPEQLILSMPDWTPPVWR